MEALALLCWRLLSGEKSVGSNAGGEVRTSKKVRLMIDSSEEDVLYLACLGQPLCPLSANLQRAAAGPSSRSFGGGLSRS